MDFVAFVQFALQIWQSDHDNQVLPYINCPQFERFAHKIRHGHLRPWKLAAFDIGDAFPFETIEVLCEASAIGQKVMPLYCEHEEGVKLVERVKDSKQVARMTLCRKNKKIADRWRQECSQLLFGEELWILSVRASQRTGILAHQRETASGRPDHFGVVT